MSEEQQVAEVAAPDAAVAQSGGEVNSDWRSQLPEDIRDHKSLAHFTDVGAMAKSLVNAQSMIGADKVVIPGKHATDEDWAEFYQKTGRPDSSQGYELENAVPEGVQASDGMLDWFRETAFEVGLRPEQAQTLLTKYNNYLGTQSGVDDEAIEAQVQETMTTLRKEFGPAYDDRIGSAMALQNEYGGTETLVEADGTPILSEDGKQMNVSKVGSLTLEDGTLVGDNPDYIRMMVNVSQFINSKIGEDEIVGMKSSGAKDPGQIQSEIDDLMAQGTPYWDQKHPKHDWSVKEVNRLMELKNG